MAHAFDRGGVQARQAVESIAAGGLEIPFEDAEATLVKLGARLDASRPGPRIPERTPSEEGAVEEPFRLADLLFAERHEHGLREMTHHLKGIHAAPRGGVDGRDGADSLLEEGEIRFARERPHDALEYLGGFPARAFACFSGWPRLRLSRRFCPRPPYPFPQTMTAAFCAGYFPVRYFKLD